MRVNLARTLSGVQGAFFIHYIKEFTATYDIKSSKIAIAYVKAGKESLESFVQFLREQGYVSAESYHLPEVKNRLSKLEWEEDGVFSKCDDELCPSYGFTVAENDIKFVEFKLIHN